MASSRPQVAPDKPLTKREALFVAEFEKDRNGLQAAIRAGYSEAGAAVTASRLLRKANVAAQLSKVESKAVTRAQVALALDEAEATASWVTTQAVKIAQYGASMVPVLGMFGPIVVDGQQLEQMADPKVAVSALSLLAKRFPEFSDKHEIEAKVGVMLVRQTRGLRG